MFSMIGTMKKPQAHRGKKCLRMSSVAVSSAAVLGPRCFIFVSSLLATSGDVAVLSYGKHHIISYHEAHGSLRG